MTPAEISIHAPRVGSDGRRRPRPPRRRNFNPRSPCGERHHPDVGGDLETIFQSTLPVWGATLVRESYSGSELFQSTLPVWGATLFILVPLLASSRFQSTLPVWGATFALF